MRSYTRSKPPRRSPLAKSNARDLVQRLLPFPIASVSAILVFLVFLSTLSALIIGAKRSSGAATVPSGISAPPTDTREIGDRPSERAATSKERDKHVPTTPSLRELATLGKEKDTHVPTIHSLRDLSPAELHPEAGPHRHIVTPPRDVSPVTLVTCNTTAGYLHILVHVSWAPLGAQRFLQMVDSGYFSTKVALMRCVRNFLCQFGIAGEPSYNKPYHVNLRDDPNWLPEGPAHRQNDRGVKRFAKGYLAYAGAGKHSRSNQLIVALADSGPLGGGSPWEVPWGEVVGGESFATLDRIYTGYGEKGPTQGRLMNRGSAGLERDFPKLDYVLGCEAIDTQ